MGAYCAQRILRDFTQLIPGHCFGAADGSEIDAVGFADLLDPRALLLLREPAHGPIELQPCGFFLRIAAGVETQFRGSNPGIHFGVASNHRFQTTPPEIAGSILDGWAGKNREWALLFPENRPRMNEIIAVGIIKSENHKWLFFRIVFPNAPHCFSHGYKIVAAQFHKTDHGIEEVRRNLKPRVRGETHLQATTGADMM